MAEIIVVGSACGFPISRRGHSSLLLSVSDRSVLIDAGEPCSRSLIEAEFPVKNIDAVLLTHGHADHIGGLPMLIQSLWLSKRQNPLTIFLPEELSKPLQQWLDAIYLGPAFIPFEIKFVAWETQQFFEELGLKIYPRETTHLQSLSEKFAPRRFRSYSLRIEHSDFRLVAFRRSRLADGFGVSTRRSGGSVGERTGTFSATRTVSVSRNPGSTEAATHAFGAGTTGQTGIGHSRGQNDFAGNVGSYGDRRAAGIVLARKERRSALFPSLHLT